MAVKITRVGNRCIVFSFDDIADASPSNVLVILGNKHVFVCDTFLGPGPMAQVADEIRKNHSNNPWIVFNSHADWDHHWGNCYFKNATIVSQESTRKAIEATGERDLVTYKEFLRGDVKIVAPNEVFLGQLRFPNEGIEFVHTPGHTLDSSSCIDLVDKVLYTGDNVELPIPYLTTPDLDTYIETLNDYLGLDIEHVVPGHGTIVASKRLISENLDYLNALKKGNVNASDSPRWRPIHEQNTRVLALYRH
ncbi:MAG: MBL fold metallo-hydrolase [Candidatus Lokiarchaeota archaeon]|nr:MBL fold metallo-hydrolase [Candidatus Lokiarchaeota archaeon]